MPDRKESDLRADQFFLKRIILRFLRSIFHERPLISLLILLIAIMLCTFINLLNSVSWELSLYVVTVNSLLCLVCTDKLFAQAP